MEHYYYYVQCSSATHTNDNNVFQFGSMCALWFYTRTWNEFFLMNCTRFDRIKNEKNSLRAMVLSWWLLAVAIATEMWVLDMILTLVHHIALRRDIATPVKRYYVICQSTKATSARAMRKWFNGIVKKICFLCLHLTVHVTMSDGHQLFANFPV